jgi:type II secretory pathway component GspD/PulD (secretin)
MKRTYIIPLALIICTLSLAVGEESSGVFKFTNAEPAALLEAYHAASGLELVVASNVRQAYRPITLKSKGPTTSTEAARLMEQALLEQAAVIVTRLNDKQASVTYNDALKIPWDAKPENSPSKAGK